MNIIKLDQRFGKTAQNKLHLAKNKTAEGALACLETFYYAFNNKDIKTFKSIWLKNDLIQLNNPLGGIIYGIDKIVELYNNIFNGESDVWVEFHDIIAFEGPDMITFAGRESGEFTKDNKFLALEIRTTRILQYSPSDEQWYLIHHHGSIDDAELLKTYQKAVSK